MAGHSGSGSTSTQTQTNKAQSNVIKTMILVCAFYVVTCSPDSMYYLLVNVANLPHSGIAHYVKTFILFMYICTNPFIYAAKFDPVRRVLLSMVICRKGSVQPAGGEQTLRVRTITVRPADERTRH